MLCYLKGHFILAYYPNRLGIYLYMSTLNPQVPGLDHSQHQVPSRQGTIVSFVSSVSLEIFREKSTSLLDI